MNLFGDIAMVGWVGDTSESVFIGHVQNGNLVSVKQSYKLLIKEFSEFELLLMYLKRKGICSISALSKLSDKNCLRDNNFNSFLHSKEFTLWLRRVPLIDERAVSCPASLISDDLSCSVVASQNGVNFLKLSGRGMWNSFYAINKEEEVIITNNPFKDEPLVDFLVEPMLTKLKSDLKGFNVGLVYKEKVLVYNCVDHGNFFTCINKGIYDNQKR